jgi:aryl-alcohol dehydrogenase-like predicted oxidoreductase
VKQCKSMTALQTVTLGPTGPTVPALGIGTWAWGDSLFWSYGRDYGMEQLQDAFETAIAHGVNFFDTAEIYGFGESERLLGRFMQSTSQPVHIATKYFPLPWRFTEQVISDTLTASLDRLQVEAVALYQVHWPFDFFLGQEKLMKVLAREVKRKRILSVGVSNYSAEQMRIAHRYLAERKVPLAVNQVQYSLLNREIETNGVLETARELGVTILAYSPLAQGLLTGKYTAEEWQHHRPMGARQLDPRFSKSGLERLEPLIDLLQSVGAKRDRLPAQVALNWLIAKGNVVPIPGAKTGKQAQQNAGALGWSLTSEEIQYIDQISRLWTKL